MATKKTKETKATTKKATKNTKPLISEPTVPLVDFASAQADLADAELKIAELEADLKRATALLAGAFNKDGVDDIPLPRANNLVGYLLWAVSNAQKLVKLVTGMVEIFSKEQGPSN